jgi:hypothetical protein
MKRLVGIFQTPGFLVCLSFTLAFLMVFTLLPHEVLAQNWRGSSDPAAIPQFTAVEAVAPDDTPVTEPPQVITTAALNITSTSAMVSGILSSLGSAEKVQVYFEYGPDSNYGSTTDMTEMLAPGSFSFNLQDLNPETTYYYRACAAGSSEEVVGEEASFATVSQEADNPVPPPDQSQPASITPAPVENLLGALSTNATEIESKRNVGSTKVTIQSSPDKDTEIISSNFKLKVKIPQGAVEKETDIEMIEQVPAESTGKRILNQFDLNAFTSDKKRTSQPFPKIFGNHHPA